MSTRDVSVGILNYNGMSVLPATLAAVDVIRYPIKQVIVVDNASTDGSPEWVEKNRPDVRCIRLKQNVGAAGGRNAILDQTQSEYVLFLDNDISVEPAALDRLVAVMNELPDAGVCHPEIMDELDPSVHHYNGGWTHFLGIYISRDAPLPGQSRPRFEEFSTVSGAAMLVRRSIAERIGRFDQDYFFNKEDGDFTTRISLAGYKCVNVPEAIVHHRSKPRGTSKTFYQVRNRWYFMLKLYSWRTLVLSLPFLLLFEIAQAGFLLLKGRFIDYLRGNLAAILDLPKTLRKRRAFQKLKVVRDRDWLHTGKFFVPTQLVPRGGPVKYAQLMLQHACNAYWMMICLGL